jgi:hypothetical protein
MRVMPFRGQYLSRRINGPSANFPKRFRPSSRIRSRNETAAATAPSWRTGAADLHFINYFAVKWIGHSTGSLVVESA